MASKVNKGFLYYLAWFAFIVVGIFCIFACVLIFNPGKDVFGINFRYVADSRTEEINKLDNSDNLIHTQSFSTMNVTAGFTNVKVIRDVNYQKITLALDKKIVGFSTSENVKYSISVTLDGSNLNVNIIEPELSLSLSPNANLTIYCPKNHSFENIDFNIKAKSGNITIGTKDEFDISLNSVNLETESGTININDKVSFVSGNATINSKSSNINVYCDVKNNLNINTKQSKVYINNISGNLNIKADELKVKADTIKSDVKFSSKNGYINIETLGDISLSAGGNFSAGIDKMHIANIVIGKMVGNLSLPNAEASDVTIDELFGEANIVTTVGNVKIGKTHNVLTVKTKSGDVSFTQLTNSRTNIQTSTGTINSNFVEIGENVNLETEKANININLKDGILAKINYLTKGKISVSWITTALEKEGTILLPNANENVANILTATAISSGNIKINNGFNAE